MRIELVCAVSLIVAAACTTIAIHSDYNRAHDFSPYRSFAWMSDDPAESTRGDTARVSALNRGRVVEAIEAELMRKGFTRGADRSRADFVVDYTIGARDRIEAYSYPSDFRGPWAWGWPYLWRDVTVRSYTEGRLAIDVFDGKTRQPVWHGYAKKRISEADIETAATQIPKAVRNILADFPPR